MKYCKYYDIEVKGIYHEDYSAKNFNRPEWNRLFSEIKKKSSGEDKNILFIKWDRFSRNVEYAYEMIGKLRKYKTTAKAIDQPIDFSVPESTVMLAVYLAVPEAENTRRAQNTANGIRRAKLMGRHPSKAPLGFINLTMIDGKKSIAPKEPEAEIIKWAFYQVAKNDHKISEIIKIVNEKGLVCSRSHFFRILHNPVYCGLIPVTLDSGEEHVVKALHEPLISESLFNQVQSVINTRRRITARKDDLQSLFFLRSFLICPVCNRKLSGSVSKGRSKNYPYYHCHNGCRTRINALFLNDRYHDKLRQLMLSRNAIELFKKVLEDQNIKTQKATYLCAQKALERKINEEELTLSRGRKLFIAGILKIDDYNQLRKENQISTKNLKKEAHDIAVKLKDIDRKNQIEEKALVEIFHRFSEFEASDKRHLVNLIPPTNIDYKTGDLSLGLNQAFLKILSKKRNRKNNRKNEFH